MGCLGYCDEKNDVDARHIHHHDSDFPARMQVDHAEEEIRHMDEAGELSHGVRGYR
jgi:hypothetical protein